MVSVRTKKNAFYPFDLLAVLTIFRTGSTPGSIDISTAGLALIQGFNQHPLPHQNTAGTCRQLEST